MKNTIVLVVVLAALSGCAWFGKAAQTASDYHSKACDVIGENRMPEFEAEAERQGVPVLAILEAFRKSCLIAHERAGEAAVGAAMGGGDVKVCAGE